MPRRISRAGLLQPAFRSLSIQRALPMLGASGAISGVMGAYLVLYPRAPVQVLVFLGFFLTTIRVPAYLMLGYWFLLQILSGLPQLSGAVPGVAFWAHVGGFTLGVAIAAVVRSGRRERPGRDADLIR
jgi:membrane associated rhomboid family serine protease